MSRFLLMSLTFALSLGVARAEQQVFSLACGGMPCQDDTHISIESYHDLAFFTDKSVNVNPENLIPLASIVNVKMNRGGQKVSFDNPVDTFQLNRSKPNWLLGFNITTRFDPLLVRNFVKDHAEEILANEIRKAREENTGLIESEVLRQVDEEVARQKGIELDYVLAEESKNLHDLDVALEQQRNVYLQRIPVEVEAALNANPDIQRIPEPFRTAQIRALKEEMVKDAIANADQELREESIRLRTLINEEVTKAVVRLKKPLKEKELGPSILKLPMLSQSSRRNWPPSMPNMPLKFVVELIR